MTIEKTPLQDCFLLKPSVFSDRRGTFFESFHEGRFKEVTGLDIDFVQDNQSTSELGVLRGLHFQTGPHAQAKLVRTVLGRVLDVVVDLRPDSNTYKRVHKVELSSDNNFQLFVPAGFAHGFITLSQFSIFAYKCDKYYNKSSEAGIIWNDPTFAIDWELPDGDIILSEKDAALPTFDNIRI
ncbi:MAG TPA: dTDP-4-dehydrorhamnose 3,5-epimerase [Salinimicrobium sp.]|nr:dTDP-4-dehydrorhamnose 3,5-epimerase [Salinimicrobium sp.]